MGKKGANTERTRLLFLIFSPKGNSQTAIVYYLIFTPSCFFITSTAKQILSQRSSPPLTMQSQLGTEHRRKELRIHAICSLTNECLGLCGFMWALGLCCCGPVTVNLLFLSRCEMYSAVKSHTGALLRQRGVHRCTHSHTLSWFAAWLLYASLNCFY